MSLWKRAVLYLTRKRGRVALLAALMFLMSCLAVIGLSFKKSAQQEADHLRQTLATGFVLEADTSNESYYEYDGENSQVYVGPEITEEMLGQILTIDGIEDYVLDLTDYVWTDLKLRPGMWAATEVDYEAAAMGGWTITEEELMVRRNQTRIWSCRNGEMHKNFRTGALSISKGRNIQEGDSFKAVISEWMAEENGLSVGDKFTVETKQGIFQACDDPMKTCGEPVELEIVGLFHTNFEQKPSDATPEDGYIENIVYADMDTHAGLRKNLGTEETNESYRKVEFLVEDPETVEPIMQQIKDLENLDMENLLLTVDSSAYQAATEPYSQIRTFSMILLAIGIGGIGIILFLVMKLWMRGRKHEAGILLSMGIRKRNIFCQILTECLLVSAIALILTFLLSKPLLYQCADVVESMTAPGENVETYEATYDGELEITSTSSEGVVLNRNISVGTIVFVIFLVGGIAGMSVILSFTQVSDMEIKEMLRLM